MSRRAAVLALSLSACVATKAAAVSVAAFTGGLPTGGVSARDKGNALLALGASGHGGRDADGSGAGGVSIHSQGVGIASKDDLGFALHSGLSLGTFSNDWFFGELDTEIGLGYLHDGKTGLGVTAGWAYGGYFSSAHSLPVRAIAYWSTNRHVAHASAFLSYRSSTDAWTGRGLESGFSWAVGKNHLGLSARYDDQDGAHVFSLSFDYLLHTVRPRW